MLKNQISKTIQKYLDHMYKRWHANANTILHNVCPEGERELISFFLCANSVVQLVYFQGRGPSNCVPRSRTSEFLGEEDN